MKKLNLMTIPVAFAAALGVNFAAPAMQSPAHAMACGYNTQLEEIPGGGSITIPIIGISLPIGGGQQNSAHFGNRISINQWVAVKLADGTTHMACLIPGDSRLGPVKDVTDARAVGSCVS